MSDILIGFIAGFFVATSLGIIIMLYCTKDNHNGVNSIPETQIKPQRFEISQHKSKKDRTNIEIMKEKLRKIEKDSGENTSPKTKSPGAPGQQDYESSIRISKAINIISNQEINDTKKAIKTLRQPMSKEEFEKKYAKFLEKGQNIDMKI